MKSACRFTPVARPVIGRVDVLEHSNASGSTTSSISWKTRCLRSWLSNTASMTRSQPARSVGLSLGWMRASTSSRFSALIRPRSTCLSSSLSGVRLAPLRRLGRDVLQHDVHACAGTLVRDAGAHHPGSENADFARGVRRHAVRAGLAAVDRLQVEEERLDHVLADRSGHEVDEVARLDPGRCLEVDLRPLDRRAHDRPGRGIVRALQLLAEVGGKGRQELSQLGRRRRAAGDPVSRAVPRLGGRLLVVPVVEHPLLGRGQQRVEVVDQVVDEPDGLGLGRLVALALEQHVHQGVLQTEHPDRAGDAATAREQTQGHLGAADLAAAVVDGDPVVRGQCDLEAASEGRAVERRDDRLAELLQPTQVGFDLLDHREDVQGVGGRGPEQRDQVTAGEERLLGRGHDHAGDGVLVGVQTVHDTRSSTRRSGRSSCWRRPAGRRA